MSLLTSFSVCLCVHVCEWVTCRSMFWSKQVISPPPSLSLSYIYTVCWSYEKPLLLWQPLLHKLGNQFLASPSLAYHGYSPRTLLPPAPSLSFPFHLATITLGLGHQRKVLKKPLGHRISGGGGVLLWSCEPVDGNAQLTQLCVHNSLDSGAFWIVNKDTQTQKQTNTQTKAHKDNFVPKTVCPDPAVTTAVVATGYDALRVYPRSTLRLDTIGNKIEK